MVTCYFRFLFCDYYVDGLKTTHTKNITIETHPYYTQLALEMGLEYDFKEIESVNYMNCSQYITKNCDL